MNIRQRYVTSNILQYRYELMNELYESLDLRVSPEFPKRHVGAVNALSIEYSCRYMLSGGGDSSIKVWDLDSFQPDPSTGDHNVEQIAEVPRRQGHEYGISAVEWWPQDNGMFITSSFDNTVKVWDANELQEAYSFNLNHKIYTISLSPCESSLVATATDHPLLRLLDLRTTSSSHTLTGHSGAIGSVKWSPTDPNVLASAGADGTVRLWDIRRSNACLCSFDMQQVGENPNRAPITMRRAHRSSVNGLCWFPGGDYLVSSGNDEKIRVWSLNPNDGKNMLINFGPLIRNRHIQTLNPCLSPLEDSKDDPYLFFPSDSGEIFMFRATTGKIIKRLTRGGAATERSACIIHRGKGFAEYYSGALDGTISCWCPKSTTNIFGDPESEDELESIGDFGDDISW